MLVAIEAPLTAPRTRAACQRVALQGERDGGWVGGEGEGAQMGVGQNQWDYFGVGVGAPLILEPILVGSGMFTEGTGFRPMAK